MPTINVKIDSDLLGLSMWSGAMRKQLPWVIAKAMTESAKKSQTALKAQTPRYVRDPVPFTMNSTFVRFASPRKLEAWVGFKDSAPKGTPAAKYLQPMVAGGIRRPKSTERQLQGAGLLRPSEFIVPTGVTPLKLNKYGNLTGGTYTQVLSRLKALGQQGYTGNVSGSRRSQSKRSARDYFIGRPGGLPRGIYARVGKRSKNGGLPRGFHTVFYITQRPTYTGTFPVQAILTNTFNNNFDRLLISGYNKELAYQASRGR